MDLNPVFVYEKGYAVADARIVVGDRKAETESTQNNKKIEGLKDVLSPKSIAVIGASSNPIKVGHSVLKSVTSNPEIRVYPVNPAISQIEGMKVYPSVLSLPEAVDLAIIAVPAEKVVEVVEECAERGVKGVLIISSGFREAEYEEGKKMQQKLVEIARKSNIRIIGPNTFGFVNLVAGVNASFTPMFSELRSGKIAFLSQSGGICHYLMHTCGDAGFSYIIHLGNRCDVDFADVLRYLKQDENTEVVAMYVEGVDNGRELFEAVKEVSAVKPVVIVKSGRSRVADKASVSHTGSMAGKYEVFTSAMRQAGAIIAETPTEVIEIARGLRFLGKLKGGVAVLSIQAGMGIVASDLLEVYGGRLSEFSEETLKKIYSLLPPITMRDNPVDIAFSGLDPQVFAGIVDAVSQDTDVALILFLYAVAPPTWVVPVSLMVDFLGKVEKPVMVVYSSTPENFRELKSAVEAIGIPVYSSIEIAAKVAATVTR
jgi:acyl-CoA synthetase (NDP forming)